MGKTTEMTRKLGGVQQPKRPVWVGSRNKDESVKNRRPRDKWWGQAGPLKPCKMIFFPLTMGKY